MFYVFIVENIKNILKYKENIKNHPTSQKVEKSPFCLPPFLCIYTPMYFIFIYFFIFLFFFHFYFFIFL